MRRVDEADAPVDTRPHSSAVDLRVGDLLDEYIETLRQAAKDPKVIPPTGPDDDPVSQSSPPRPGASNRRRTAPGGEDAAE